MDFFSKIIAASQNMEGPHTWSNLGTTLQAQKSQPLAEVAFVSKNPIKKRVFDIGTSFWLTVLLVGGAYVLIEKKVPNITDLEDIGMRALYFIEEVQLVGEQAKIDRTKNNEVQSGVKRVENTYLGYEMMIPERLKDAGEDMDVNPFYSDTNRNDIQNLVFMVQRNETSKEPDPILYTKWLSSAYAGNNFTLIEEGNTELNSLPAKKYIYEFDNESSRTRGIHVVLELGGFTYKLMMFDDVDDFSTTLVEFEETRKSFKFLR